MSLKSETSDRDLPSVPYSIQKKDPSEALTELERARQMLRQAEIKGDKDEIPKRKAAVTKAGNRVKACFISFTIRALPPEDYEDLIDEHPPTPEQTAAAGKDPSEQPEWNDETFYPALLTKCVDEDMDEKDWEAFLKRKLSRGERRQLEYALVAVNENVRMPESLLLPKGLLGTGILRSNSL